MSSAFSRKMQGVATRLLDKYGSTVMLVRAGGKVWDGTLAEWVQQPSTSIALTSVPVPVNASLVDGTTIQVGDMIVKADYSVIPSMDDKVEFGGAQWSIQGIEKKMVNDDIVAYFIQVRK